MLLRQYRNIFRAFPIVIKNAINHFEVEKLVITRFCLTLIRRLRDKIFSRKNFRQ